jgi:hypothetical protein
MYDRVDAVLRKQVFQQCHIAGIADDEFAGGNRRLETSREVVERDDVFALLAQLPYDVAADVAGTASD